MEEQQQSLPCQPPCEPLLQLQEDMRQIKLVLLGDRGNPDSMRKSVFGTVERWGNWMDATMTVFKIAGASVPVLAAGVAIAKATGIF